jgi:hypothetical protein
MFIEVIIVCMINVSHKVGNLYVFNERKHICGGVVYFVCESHQIDICLQCTITTHDWWARACMTHSLLFGAVVRYCTLILVH